MSRLARDGTAEPVSRDQILRRERGHGNIFFPCSADEQDWQPYPVDPYSCYKCDHTYTYINSIELEVAPRSNRDLMTTETWRLMFFAYCKYNGDLSV